MTKSLYVVKLFHFGVTALVNEYINYKNFNLLSNINGKQWLRHLNSSQGLNSSKKDNAFAVFPNINYTGVIQKGPASFLGDSIRYFARFTRRIIKCCLRDIDSNRGSPQRLLDNCARIVRNSHVILQLYLFLSNECHI